MFSRLKGIIEKLRPGQKPKPMIYKTDISPQKKGKNTKKPDLMADYNLNMPSKINHFWEIGFADPFVKEVKKPGGKKDGTASSDNLLATDAP